MSQTHGRDRFGRTLAEVMLPDGTNLNQELVREGWCWWFWKYAPTNTALEKLEAEARNARRGLWADPNPVPPWVFRKKRSGQSLDESDLLLLEPGVSGNVTERGPPAIANTQAAISSSPFPILGNRRSHIYHRADCPNYSSIAPHNRIRFSSAVEAEAAGYRLSENCP